MEVNKLHRYNGHRNLLKLTKKGSVKPMGEDHKSSLFKSVNVKSAPKIKEGDWVICAPRHNGNGKMFRGFVESVVPTGDPFKPNIYVTVTESEKDWLTVGKTVNALIEAFNFTVLNDIEGLYYEQSAVENMIEFALISGDKPLFMRMTKRLKVMQADYSLMELDQNET